MNMKCIMFIMLKTPLKVEDRVAFWLRRSNPCGHEWRRRLEWLGVV